MAEELRFTEYRSVAISEPLRQGDVLEKVSPESTAWDRHLLVITADCDFAHGKHQGRVTCVPLLTKSEYLLELLFPKIREQTLEKLVSTARTILRDLSAPDISEPRLKAWPVEQKTEDILSSLSILNGENAALAGVLDGIREISVTPGSIAAAVDSVVRAQRGLPNSKSETNIRKEIKGRLQGVFRQTPGDALFISTIADRYDEGYFVYLRHLEQIWETDITLGPSRSAVSYRRLSRIRESYTHAIAQRFALVFMSIGMPDIYEEMRDFHANLLMEEIN